MANSRSHQIEVAAYQFKNPPPRRERDDVAVNVGGLRKSLESCPTLHRRSSVVAPLDREAMTLTAVVASDHPVQRRDARGVFLEVLPPAALVMIEADVPLLDSHNQGRAIATIGRVHGFRTEGNAVIAEVRLSTAPDVQPIADRLADGSLRHFSSGYRVVGWKETAGPNGERIRTATQWTILEVSVVSIPADPNARKRSSTVDEDDIDTIDTAMPEADQIAIRSIGENLDLPPSAADEQIEAGATVADARTALRTRALEDRRQRSASTRIRTTAAGPSPDDTRAARIEAIACRMSGANPSDAARPYMGLRLQDHAADCLVTAGVQVRGMSADELFVRAGQHTTSDFPLLVSNAMGKVAADSYKAAESPLRVLCKQRNLSNFKESTAIRLGELGRLEPLSESGEFRHTTRAEGGETMELATYGRAINVSRKLLIDDDLNLLGDMNAAFGEAAAQTEADILVGLLLSNPKMADGKTVFLAGRGNVGTASAITVPALNAARQALRSRKGLDGKTPISAPPKYLLVGPQRETEAEAILATLNAGTLADVNPFAGKLTLLVEPRIEDGRWFVFADPVRVPSLQFGYLASAPGVQIQRTEAWDVLGAKFRAWLDFGAGWLDWRGVQSNAGL